VVGVGLGKKVPKKSEKKCEGLFWVPLSQKFKRRRGEGKLEMKTSLAKSRDVGGV